MENRWSARRLWANVSLSRSVAGIFYHTGQAASFAAG
jgi:hypothetical protein